MGVADRPTPRVAEILVGLDVLHPPALLEGALVDAEYIPEQVYCLRPGRRDVRTVSADDTFTLVASAQFMQDMPDNADRIANRIEVHRLRYPIWVLRCQFSHTVDDEAERLHASAIIKVSA